MKKESLNLIDQLLYDFLDTHVDEMPDRLVKLIAFNYTDARIRKKYLRRLGVYMGEGTYTNLGLKLAVGEREKGEPLVDIKANVSIGPGVTFICDESANNGIEINSLPYVRDIISRSGKIVIEDDVWIGANVTILSGVTVGKCTVIGAGSVVLHDLDSYSVYAGVPAKKIRTLK